MIRKKLFLLALAITFSVFMLVGCGEKKGTDAKDSAETGTTDTNDTTDAAGDTAETKEPVTIKVVSSYGADDGNRTNYEDGIKGYEESTGNKVVESSSNANEEWKASVHADFEVGAEPDVLFFFNGVDSNPLIEANAVVSIDEIREVYPEYAANMKDDMMGASPVDGKNYSVPVNGFWEAMFCNKTVLEAAGVTIPAEGYTWDQFLADCEKIKNAGYTPVAVSFHEVPHYWFEYCVLNNGGLANHLTVPASADDVAAANWVSGLNDMKVLYDNGYLPDNALSAGDAETFQLMADDKAAFAIDGSWKCGWFAENADPANFVVTFPPTKEARKSTELIGGISMGYYISRQAWEDETKREACVKFVEYMTSDEVVSKFSSAGNVTALKNGATPDPNANELIKSVTEMNSKVTNVIGAVQDTISGEQKTDLFGNVKIICDGSMTAEEALASMLSK
jgi:raffinose/stachyose/melibiose transport system substrate-binding protein